MRKLSAFLLILFILLLATLNGSETPAAATVPPGFEVQSELLTAVEPVGPSPTADDDGAAAVGADMTAERLQTGAVRSEPGALGAVQAWLATHGLATVKGAAVGLAVGGLVAVGAAALGILGAPVLLVVGAGVLGGALYGASVGNAEFSWLAAAGAAALSSITVATGGAAAGAGRAGTAGLSALRGRLLGGLVRNAAGSPASMVRTALGTTRSPAAHLVSNSVRTAAGSAIRTTGNLALTAADAVETVAVLADREASWQEKALAGLSVLPVGAVAHRIGKAPLRIVDRVTDRISDAASPVTRIIERSPAADVKPGYRPRKYWTRETEFQGKKVYLRDDLIDLDRVGPDGRTNRERMAEGNAPIGPDGRPIHLHHLIQTDDGPIAEVKGTLHVKNGSILHLNTGQLPSGINRRAFNRWRKAYWIARQMLFRTK